MTNGADSRSHYTHGYLVFHPTKVHQVYKAKTFVMHNNAIALPKKKRKKSNDLNFSLLAFCLILALSL